MLIQDWEPLSAPREQGQIHLWCMQNGDEMECKVTLVNVLNEKRWLAYLWVELLTKNTSEIYIWHCCQEVCKISAILMTNIVLIKRAKGLWQSYFIKCHWMWHLDIGHWIWQYEWLAGLGSSYHRCWRQPIFCFSRMTSLIRRDWVRTCSLYGEEFGKVLFCFSLKIHDTGEEGFFIMIIIIIMIVI